MLVLINALLVLIHADLNAAVLVLLNAANHAMMLVDISVLQLVNIRVILIVLNHVLKNAVLAHHYASHVLVCV